VNFRQRLNAVLKDWGRDGLLLLVFFIIFLVLAKLTFDDRFSSNDSGLAQNTQQRSVASIESSQNTVMVKSSDLPVWRAVDTTSAELSNQDQIFTDRNSRAELKFKNGGSVFLEQNSLVVIDDSGGDTDLKLEKGFITGSGDSAKPLKITAGKVKLELNNSAKVKVSVGEDNTTNIQSISGTAQFVSNGKIITVEENQVAAITQEGVLGEVTKLRVKQLAPEDGEEIYFVKSFSKIFKWSKDDDVKSVTLSIAKDQSFKQIVHTFETDKTELLVNNLQSGLYFWKVVPTSDSKENKKLYSGQSLRLTEIASPTLLKPANRESVEFTEPSATEAKENTGFSVTLHWQSQSQDKHFEVALAKDSAFQQVILSKMTEQSHTDVEIQEEGRIFWRVRQERVGDIEAPWSDVWEFNVHVVKLLSTPIAVSPLANEVATFRENTREIYFKVESMAGVRAYQVEVSTGKTFSPNDTVSLESKNNQISWTPERVGEFFWRARVVDFRDRATAFSEPIAFKVAPTPPELKQPGSKTSINLLKEKQVRLSWGKSNFAESYSVDIATDQEFKEKAFSDSVESTDLIWTPPTEGKYFWRVRSVFNHKVESDFSSVREFEAMTPPLPEPPAIPSTIEMLIESTDELDVGGFDETTKTVVGRGPRRARLHWDKAPGAIQYQLEISRSKDFKVKIYNVLLKDSEFTWDGVQPGVYFYRVASIDEYGRISVFSEPGVVEANFSAPSIQPNQNFELTNGETADITLSWKARPKSDLTEIEIAKDSAFEQIVSSQQTAEKTITTKLGLGQYFWRVRRLHPADHKGRWSQVGQLGVFSSGVRRASEQQGVASNRKYNSSEIDFNGFLWTLYSSEQYYTGEAAPVASGIGVHGYYWGESNGFEGSFKTGAIGLNNSGGGQSALKDFEARYHRRFFTQFPFGWARELQISGFAGYELYRNAGGSFSSQYDLIKIGTTLNFPWAEKWTGGGEFVYGYGLDKSMKFEISGNIGYFFSPNWSLGAGYRLHLFEAGSAASASQAGLPYREGYTEIFSALFYNF
jgi:hypothetical protein